MAKGDIPVLCPSLTAWLNKTSEATAPIGEGGPNADQLAPAAAMVTNRQVVANLLARAGGNATFAEYGKFAGPFGLTLNDLFHLHTSMAYMRGHADANGLSESDWAEYMLAEIAPGVQRLDAIWREKYPDFFTETETKEAVSTP
jgi:hypothetical protein